ncbi:Mitochondrial-processing peptidase subunit beta [Massospora cicadina]|nr:Mitochondrial-processing peptidase subunit beta [Massospora cicadina]
MAFRLLPKSSLKACLFNKASRTGSLSFRAGLASAAPAPGTQITVLPNGLTVATQTHPGAQTATVGVMIDAGSRAENAKNNGTAHFLEHMAFKGTSSRSQADIELQIENMGAHLNAYTSREQTVYYAKCFKDDVAKSIDILSDILQNSTFDAQAVERERDVILTEQVEVEKNIEELVFDHLHATAFQGHPLGRTILGPKDNIRSITAKDLRAYIGANYAPERVVVAGAGAVSHQRLVELATRYFSNLPAPNSPEGLSAVKTKPTFVGSEVRIRHDDKPAAHIAMAVEGVGWGSPDYFPMLLMSSLVGNWDRSMGSNNFLSSRLSHVVSQGGMLANSYMSFNTSYFDTGLWGIYLISENRAQLDDLVYFTQQEWARLTTSVTEAEVTRAKQQLKAGLLFSLDNTTAVFEDMCRQIITTGRHVPPSDVAAQIDRLTSADIRRVAGQYLWDAEVAVVGYGPVESLLDYTRVRGNMSWNRF